LNSDLAKNFGLACLAVLVGALAACTDTPVRPTIELNPMNYSSLCQRKAVPRTPPGDPFGNVNFASGKYPAHRYMLLLLFQTPAPLGGAAQGAARVKSYGAPHFLVGQDELPDQAAPTVGTHPEGKNNGPVLGCLQVSGPRPGVQPDRWSDSPELWVQVEGRCPTDCYAQGGPGGIRELISPDASDPLASYMEKDKDGNRHMIAWGIREADKDLNPQSAGDVAGQNPLRSFEIWQIPVVDFAQASEILKYATAPGGELHQPQNYLGYIVVGYPTKEFPYAEVFK
jgi:hypothetical protein